DPGSASLDRGEPPLWQASLCRREFDAVSGEPPVRAGADPDIILIAPIGEVVSAFGAWPRMVRDLVGREAVRDEPVLRHLEQCRRDLLFGQHDRTASLQGGKGGAGF